MWGGWVLVGQCAPPTEGTWGRQMDIMSEKQYITHNPCHGVQDSMHRARPFGPRGPMCLFRASGTKIWNKNIWPLEQTPGTKISGPWNKNLEQKYRAPGTKIWNKNIGPLEQKYGTKISGPWNKKLEQKYRPSGTKPGTKILTVWDKSRNKTWNITWDKTRNKTRLIDKTHINVYLSIFVAARMRDGRLALLF